MLLALDTSTRTIGLALYDGAQVLAESVWTSRDHHTVELAPAVEEILRKSGVEVKDLQALGVALGPGSFTGLRIGLAFAKGLALVRHVDLIGIPTLEALAAAQPVQSLPMAAVLKAGRGRLAVSWYHAEKDAWQSDKQIEVLTAQELAEKIETPTLICGELDEDDRRVFSRKRRMYQLASPARSLRSPAFLAELAWRRWQAKDIDDPATLAPVYLHYKDPIPE